MHVVAAQPMTRADKRVGRRAGHTTEAQDPEGA